MLGGQLECRFIALLGLGEVFAGAVQVAVVEVGGDMGLMVGRLDCESLLVAVVGEVGPAVGDEGDAQVEPGSREAGAELEGLPIESDCVGMSGEFGQAECESEVGLRAVGAMLQGAGKGVGSRGVVFPEGVGVAEAVVGGSQGGVELDRLFEVGNGLIGTVGDGEKFSEAEMGLYEGGSLDFRFGSGRVLECSLEGGLGGFDLA